MAPWKIAGLAALLGAVVVGVAWLFVGAGAAKGGVAVLGDEAPALHEAMGTSQALPLHTAAVTVVSVQGWERLRYIPDMADLCGQECYGESAMVRVVPLTPGNTRKIVFVNLEAWPGTEGLTKSTEEKDFACAASAITSEFGRIAAGDLPECAADVPVTDGTRWVLPAGLGAI